MRQATVGSPSGQKRAMAPRQPWARTARLSKTQRLSQVRVLHVLVAAGTARVSEAGVLWRTRLTHLRHSWSTSGIATGTPDGCAVYPPRSWHSGNTGGTAPSIPERGAARPPHVLHVEFVVIDCCVLLDGVMLGTGAVP